MMRLAGLAFQMGFLVGLFMHLLVETQSKILLQALLYIRSEFTSFSAIFLLSKRRSMFFFWGAS